MRGIDGADVLGIIATLTGGTTDGIGGAAGGGANALMTDEAIDTVAIAAASTQLAGGGAVA